MKRIISFSLIVIVLIVVVFSIIKHVILGSKIQNNNGDYDITYNILDFSKNNSIYKEKGYYINNKEDNKVLITIVSGMKTTGGFDIDIENIIIDNKNVKIFVKETEPPEDAIVNQVINYPIVQVEFSEKPESLEIKNIDNNSSYKKITS